LVRFGFACLAAAGSRLRPTFAQARYPERPIRLVVPFPPGSVSDTLGRLWAKAMATRLGSVFVENQGGAGGLVGGAAVARAHPDGYTILLSSAGSPLIVPEAMSYVQHDPVKDLQLISVLTFTALAIVVHPSLPARSLAELVDYAKANPGKLSYGSAGIGTMPHLAGELLKSLTGAGDIVHVPYKGSSRASADLINGQIMMMVTSITGQMMDLHRSGKVRILAVTTPTRATMAPEIPTAIEAGVPGMVAQNFIGLFVPAATPQEIVAQIGHANATAMADPGFRQELVALGFEPYPDPSPEAARRLIDDEIARWKAVIKAAGLKLE
jgi:tripartite-type tricarboxylate transporter receptor subunit TctC